MPCKANWSVTIIVGGAKAENFRYDPFFNLINKCIPWADPMRRS